MNRYLTWALSCAVICGSASAAPIVFEAPKQPPVRFEQREPAIKCVSGAVQSLRPGLRIHVMPVANLTDAKMLQPLIEQGFVKVFHDMSVVAMPWAGGFNLQAPDPAMYDLIARADITLVDRAVVTRESKSELDIAGGKGRGSSFFGRPESEKFVQGEVGVTVTLHRPGTARDTAGRQLLTTSVVASVHAAAPYYNHGTSSGVDISLLLGYQSSDAVERQGGMQRAALTALRAAAARAVLEFLGVHPEVCRLGTAD